MEHAVLIGLITPSQPEERTQEYLDELAFLADTRDIEPVRRFVQRADHADTNTYIGSGKIQEINRWIEDYNKSADAPIDMVIFDDELSPRQIRNIENVFNQLCQDAGGVSAFAIYVTSIDPYVEPLRPSAWRWRHQSRYG